MTSASSPHIQKKQNNRLQVVQDRFFFTGDAMEAALALAESIDDAEFVVYECRGVWHVASHPLFRLQGYATELRMHSPLGVETYAGMGSDWSAISEVLQQVPLSDWRAYGYATFEAASLNVRPCKDVLVDLMIPAMEARLSEKEVELRATTKDDLQRMRSVLMDAGSRTWRTPQGVNVNGRDTVYVQHVAEGIRRIREGELTKVILSRRVPVPFAVDMLGTFHAGRRANHPARSFVLHLGGWEAAGFSPERVLEVDSSGRAITQPLAGTRATAEDPMENARLRAELLTDTKEVYEHATSVHLAVEELKQVGCPGSTHIEEFMEVRQRGSVQHLASQVSTTLRADRSVWDAMQVVFPAITASGIPKREALRLINELEEMPRGLYAGTVMMAASDGSLDAALVLRSVYQRNGKAWLQAGAGIVGLSHPEREHEETCEKFRTIAPYVVARD